MESLYKFPKNELINIREYMEKYLEELQKFPLPKNQEDIMRMMKFSGSNAEFQKLKNSVMLDAQLPTEDAIPIIDFDFETNEKTGISKPLLNIANEAFDLETSKELLEFRKIIVPRFARKRLYPFGKSEYTFKFIRNDFEPPVDGDEILEPYTDVIISIRVYRPFRYISGKTTYGPTFQEEILVLGSQYLSELRDKISCSFKNQCVIEISSNPNQENPSPKTNPGFFFITDTFYNDTRNPDNLDYSSTIRKWLENRKDFQEEKFKTAKMEDIKFFDLNLRIGYPQVYQHNGNCEHLFCVSSIQLLTEEDQLNKSNYPILRSISVQKYSACNMCGTAQFTYLVKDSKRQLYDAAYLCNTCFEKYHYIDGKKIGNFKAYRIYTPNTEKICHGDTDDEDTFDNNGTTD